MTPQPFPSQFISFLTLVCYFVVIIIYLTWSSLFTLVFLLYFVTAFTLSRLYLCSSSLTSLCMRRFKCFTVRTAVSGTSIVTMLMSDIARWMRQLKLVIQTMRWWWSIWWIISWYSTTQTTIHTVSCWLKEIHWVNEWTKFDECCE